MKTIKKDEIYKSLNGFLKSKGIKLSSGTYSKAVRKACGFLTDAVNVAQEGVHKTKIKVDTNLDKLRQTVHDATAPKPPILKPKKKKAKAVKKKSVKKKATSKTAPKKPSPKKAVKKKVVSRKKTTRTASKLKSKKAKAVKKK